MRLFSWILLSILLSFSLAATAHADKQTDFPFEVGAKAAYSRITFFRGSGIQGAGKLRSRNSFAAGLSSHYRLHTTKRVHLGVQPELLFVRRGADGELDGRIVAAWHLSYLEVPALGRVSFPLSGSVSPYIVAGPRFGLLLSAETTDVNGNVQDGSDSTNTFDFGFSAGAGAVFHVGSGIMVSIDGRYDQSLLNRIKLSTDEVTNDQRHRAFFLMLGVSMGIGAPAPAVAASLAH